MKRLMQNVHPIMDICFTVWKTYIQYLLEENMFFLCIYFTFNFFVLLEQIMHSVPVF